MKEGKKERRKERKSGIMHYIEKQSYQGEIHKEKVDHTILTKETKKETFRCTNKTAFLARRHPKCDSYPFIKAVR